MRLLPILLIALLALPLLAQEVPTDEAGLRQWYQSLPKEQKERLRHRQRVFKRLDKDRQQQAMADAKAGKPILTTAERENLEQLRTMGYLQRARLMTLANELQMLKRTGGPEFKRAMDLEGAERVKALHQMLVRRRALAFLRTLPDTEQQRLAGLPPMERQREAMKLYEEHNRKRRAALEEAFPHVKELKQKARAGDQQAREELRRVMADVWTLDMMLQRLNTEARDRVMAQLPNLSIEKAADLLRKELKEQWQNEMREHKRNNKPQPRDGGFGPANRNGTPGEDRKRKGSREQ